MKFPISLRYSKDHLWVQLDHRLATIGLTRFAQATLGQIQNLELLNLGSYIYENKLFGQSNGTKSTFDLYSPLDGTIVEIRSALQHELTLIDTHPHSEGWLIRIEIELTSQFKKLMNATDYRRFIQAHPNSKHFVPKSHSVITSS